VNGAIADAGGAWTFGASILSFAFPMILFIVVISALYILYTRPEVVPGRPAPAIQRPVSYTALPGKPATDREAPAGPADAATASQAVTTVEATTVDEQAADEDSGSARRADSDEAAGTEDAE
jgi:hypothetical protein